MRARLNSPRGSIQTKMADVVEITQEDIPGACVTEENIGKMTVSQLKFWLKCRRVNQSGNKKELSERVRNLNSMTNLKVYDPDPEKSYTRAKLERMRKENAELCVENEPFGDNPFADFPNTDSAFSSNLTLLPQFVPTDTLEHLKNSGKSTSRKSNDAIVELSSSKGLRLLPFVHDVQINQSSDTGDGIIYLRALCWASYRKSVKYKVKMIIQRSGKPKIRAAECDKLCPAGKSGCCCHVMAVIWKLDEMSRTSVLQLTDNLSCTSQPQKWGKPGKRSVQHNPVMSQKLFKPRHSTDAPGKKRRGVLPTLFDPRPSKSPKLDVESVAKLKQALSEVNPSVPFSKMLPDADNIVLVDTIVGKVAQGSVLHVQLNEVSTNTRLTCSNNISPISVLSSDAATSCVCVGGEVENDRDCASDHIISPVKEHPVSIEEVKNRCDRIKRKLFKTENEIAEIESQTRDQSACKEWFKHRFGRVTASKSHRVGCKHRADTSPTKIIKEVLNYNNNYQSQAMKDGLANEQLVIDRYIEEMQERGHAQLKVEKCGFFVEKNNGILGASPDGLVTDPSACNPDGTIEAKCIIVKDGETLRDTLIRKAICKKSDDPGLLEVNRNHMYFYQVQQQLFVVNRCWGVLVIMGSNKELFWKKIVFEPEWWSEKHRNIEEFYNRYILHELAYPRIKYGLTRYDFNSNSC